MAVPDEWLPGRLRLTEPGLQAGWQLAAPARDAPALRRQRFLKVNGR